MAFEATGDYSEHVFTDGHLEWVIISCALGGGRWGYKQEMMEWNVELSGMGNVCAPLDTLA